MFSNPTNYTIYNAFNHNILAIINKIYFFFQFAKFEKYL